jgi:hypothetical protein
MKMNHSKIVGGSTAKRVINCPGSVALVQQAPPQVGSRDADTGSALHYIMSEVLGGTVQAQAFVDASLHGIKITQQHLDDKIGPALAALDDIGTVEMPVEFAVEQTVDFGTLLPQVFGSVDLIGRYGDTALVLDWKFGDGVTVEVEENEQLMFYACAAMRTRGLEWVFDGATQVELVIVQPPAVRRWVTTFDRLRAFERTLVHAVKVAQQPRAPINAGSHCRFCPAKTLCPAMTGATDRLLATQLATIDTAALGAALAQAELVEARIGDLRALALQLAESGQQVPGWKLVNKRAVRSWADAEAAKAQLLTVLEPQVVCPPELISPAQAEKALKKAKRTDAMPQVTAVSSGFTLAAESDPRPAAILIGQQLTAALGKLV